MLTYITKFMILYITNINRSYESSPEAICPIEQIQAVAADQAVHAIGMPEAGVVIAQCVTSPKWW